MRSVSGRLAKLDTDDKSDYVTWSVDRWTDSSSWWVGLRHAGSLVRCRYGGSTRWASIEATAWWTGGYDGVRMEKNTNSFSSVGVDFDSGDPQCVYYDDDDNVWIRITSPRMTQA